MPMAASFEAFYLFLLGSVVLLAWAILDLVNREQMRGANKVVWALVVIFLWSTALFAPILTPFPSEDGDPPSGEQPPASRLRRSAEHSLPPPPLGPGG